VGPVISVIMPVLNGEPEHLKLAIESILQQSMKNFEFIIIDDCSNQETKQLLNTYCAEDGRIRIITNETNIGIAKSLNYGISLAAGEIIARHDADDIAEPTRLQQQFEMLNENKSIIGCFTAVKHINMTGKVISEFPVSETSQTLEAELFLNSRLCHPTMFMYKSAIDNVGGYPLTKFAQDFALYTKMIRQGYAFGGINKPLVRYRITEGGVTQSKREIQLDIASEIAFNHVKFYLPSINEVYFKQFWLYVATQGNTALTTLVFINNLKLIFYIAKNEELRKIWLPAFKWITSNHYDRSKNIAVFVRLMFFHLLVKIVL
jgi:glycosyltransferase involved in cell wall biosynthesis